MHADPGQRRERRHHEQEMPHPGERGAVADDLAEQREHDGEDQHRDVHAAGAAASPCRPLATADHAADIARGGGADQDHQRHLIAR